ncbi:MAG: T9SS type A sorting domain-containing protein [Bacteroidota bacterium]
MKKLYILLILILSVVPSFIFAQNLVSATNLGRVTTEDLGPSFAFLVSYDMNQYKITYTTKDVFGEETVASGLVVVPEIEGFALPTTVYQHGTVFDRAAVPSNNVGEAFVGQVLAGSGYVAVLPDYLGLGDNPGIHPYLHADTEASVAIDMLFAVEELAEQEGFVLNDQLFVTGYSQGGHAAAALHRSLQEDFSDVFNVTAAAYGAGPYDLSGITRQAYLVDEDFFFPGYSLSTFVMLNYVYQLFDGTSAYLKAPYAGMVDLYIQDSVNLEELNDLVLPALVEQTGSSVIKDMFQDSIINIMTVNDPAHPLVAAFRDNDVYEWAPQAPTRMYYCVGDNTVSYLNSVLADSVMQSLGAVDLQALNLGDNLDHVDCAFPAILGIWSFFGGFREFTTNTEELELEDVIELFPNPASSKLFIRGASLDAQLTLFNAQGQYLRQIRVQDYVQELDIADLQRGVYWIQLSGEQGVGMKKFVKQ